VSSAGRHLSAPRALSTWRHSLLTAAGVPSMGFRRFRLRSPIGSSKEGRSRVKETASKLKSTEESRRVFIETMMDRSGETEESIADLEKQIRSLELEIEALNQAIESIRSVYAEI